MNGSSPPTKFTLATDTLRAMTRTVITVMAGAGAMLAQGALTKVDDEPS